MSATIHESRVGLCWKEADEETSCWFKTSDVSFRSIGSWVTKKLTRVVGILVWCTNSVFIKCKQVLDLTLDIATDCVADEYPHEVQVIHLWELSPPTQANRCVPRQWGVPLGFRACIFFRGWS